MKKPMNNVRLIETDNFDFEFLSQLAERESWRKEIHRPIYHLHKWWAKRLGSVFRGILLGSLLSKEKKLSDNFYFSHNFSNTSVFDPFMGSGTTVGEAHKLGLTALGRDINPVAVESVRVALGPMDKEKIDREFKKLTETVGQKILGLYRSTDSEGLPCDVLYYFWVMQADCPMCDKSVDLFSSWTIARNAYPNRKPEVQVLCPGCDDIFPTTNGIKEVSCKSCNLTFAPDIGNANGAKAKCSNCHHTFPILSAVENKRPKFRLYGKLILTKNGQKEYLKVTEKDLGAFKKASEQLDKELRAELFTLPESNLENGYNTKQAISYGFKSWKDFFNHRQLLGLGWLNNAIATIEDKDIRDLFLLSFSGALEFNNLFASYKGEGTGAVRHMFAHHILKPERTPIEANIWGTPKSSGSFSNLFRNRIDRAIAYRQEPTEVNGGNGTKGKVCSSPFTGKVEDEWPNDIISLTRKTYLSCGDSSVSKLPSESIDLVVTDPPFFDNVHYSELADFFYAWQRLVPRGFINKKETTRSTDEVQDSDPIDFANKLQAVFQECNRVLKDDGLLVFTYHHSRDEGWRSVANAVLNAGFSVVNAHPVKSEMSGATPKSQASEPIQLDIVIVCRKGEVQTKKQSPKTALDIAQGKISRLESSGFSLSKNDKKVIIYGQLLASLQSAKEIALLPAFVEQELTGVIPLPLGI
jgi:putative DNA methylase